MNEEKEGECYCCGFEGIVKCYSSGRTEEKWLCKLCASTIISNSSDYPTLYKHDYNGKAALYAANVILAEMKKERMAAAVVALKKEIENIHPDSGYRLGFESAITFLEGR